MFMTPAGVYPPAGFRFNVWRAAANAAQGKESLKPCSYGASPRFGREKSQWFADKRV